MKTALLIAAALVAAPALAQRADKPAAPPSPGEIVAAAPASEWSKIAADELLVMDLAADASGKARRVVIQLIPAPFGQPWVANIRTLAKAHWWDGLAIVRAQDNYVVQWGDPNADDAATARALPAALRLTAEADYTVPTRLVRMVDKAPPRGMHRVGRTVALEGDAYADFIEFQSGWPAASDGTREWPVHCYGAVGVGRGMSPDAGSGAELYTVIGHAPRHLDRNIAVVGRVIEGIEHLSTLPRGTEALGFYKTPEERTPIVSIRLGGDVAGLPAYEYLSTEGESFARYADARANRRDPFFIVPAGGADVCNIPVPVRRVP